MKNKGGKPKMLEREAWRFINNRRKDDAEYLKSLDSVSNQEERELLWKNYLREADQWEEECRRVINSGVSGYTIREKTANRFEYE
jgi:hypothetical protein